jgi:hypothetical protein
MVVAKAPAKIIPAVKAGEMDKCMVASVTLHHAMLLQPVDDQNRCGGGTASHPGESGLMLRRVTASDS